MDILVTFDDGTTELRADNSPVHTKSYPFVPTGLPREWEEAVGYAHGYPLWLARGQSARVWRLTGHTEEPYTFTGEWQSCRVETVDEQIARLTRERDAARRIAALDRICLDTWLHAEMTALVRQAKKEGWL